MSENEFGAYIYGNTNNMITFKESGASHNYNDRYEFTYNENNYPITSTYISVYGNGDEDVETIEYIYE